MADADVDAFERARADFLRGLAALEAGRFDAAEAHFLASLERVPGRVSTLINLAATRLALGRAGDALASADQVLAIEPDNPEAFLHRGTALGLLGRHAQALACHERLLALGAPPGPVWLRHGQTLQALDQPERALASYQQALDADPALAQAWTNRGNILREMQRTAEAAEAFRRAIAHGADPQLHRYYLASLGADAVPAIAPAHYVETLFDDYADTFDAHLVGTLGYSAHRTVTAPLADLGRAPFRSALDLGCGTGLCGPLVKPLAQRLEGVDLSAAMLAKAAELNVYDRLVQADVASHLASTDERHDLVLAADVFIYIGALDDVFAGVRRVLAPGGVFCFSAELAEDDTQDFRLLTSLRYAQSERYLRALAQRRGFEVLHWLNAPIREDQRVSIPGVFVYLTPAPGIADS